MKKIFFIILGLFLLFLNPRISKSANPTTQPPNHLPLTFIHTTQADWMLGERDHLDVRTLDAMGTPYGWDADPRGAMRLRSQPGEWSEHSASPVVLPGDAGAWDDAVISEAKVIFDGATFHLWYAGRWRHPEGLKTPMDVGYATSPDGVQWTKYEANPVLVRGELGGYDENIISAPMVLFDGETYHMWFSAVNFKGDWSLNYAASTNGVRWIKTTQNPLLKETHDARWDAVYLAEPYVLWNGSGFQMWYNGASAQTQTLLGYATSPDGLNWTRFAQNRPVLDVAPDGVWDDFAVARACVMYDGERYQMWYEGHNGGTWRIGYATSPDGIAWTRGAENPIVDLGMESSWKSKVASEPNVIFDGQLYRLYHSGYDGDLYRVGLVTAPPVYEERGVFTSTAFVHAAPARWGTLSIDLSLPAQTAVDVAVATSDDGGVWGAWREVGSLESSQGFSGTRQIDLYALDVPAGRALRYRLTLRTANLPVSPLIREVRLSEAFPDFSITLPEGVVSLRPGARAAIKVSLEGRQGFAAPVHLSVSGLPEALSATWAPGFITPPGTATFNLEAGAALPPGMLPLTLTAASGDLIHEAVLDLNVLEPLPTSTPMPTLLPTATLTPLPPRREPAALATPTPEPLSPPPTFQFRVGAPGGMLALIGAAALLLWLGALLVFRPPQSDEAPARRPLWRHWAWVALPILLVLSGTILLWRDLQIEQRAWEAEHDRLEALPTATRAPLPWLSEAVLREAIQARIVAPYLRTLTVTCLDQTAVLSVADLGFQSNQEELIAGTLAAMETAAGQKGVEAFLRGEPSEQFSFQYTTDDEKAHTFIQDIADRVQTRLLEHRLDEDTLTFWAGHAGVQLDVEQAVAQLQAAVDDLSVTQVDLPVVVTDPKALSETEIDLALARILPDWNQPPVPASTQPITIPFDVQRWIVGENKVEDWTPTRPMTGYQFLPGQVGWTLNVTTAKQIILDAAVTGVQDVSFKVIADVPPAPLTLAEIEPALLDVVGHFDGFNGFYVQDLTTGEEIRHNSMVTASGMSMIKVAVMVTAYRALPQPFSADLKDAMAQMIAHSINEKSNYVILQIGEGDFQAGLKRINETLAALDMRQTYIRQGYRTPEGPFYEPITVPEHPPADVPPEEQINLWPDTAMQTSLADQAILFEALYRGTLGEGKLLAAFSNLTAQDCQAMLDLLKTNPTRTLLGPGFADDVPMAHKNGFGGGSNTDERMNVGIVWPPEGRPYLVGIYQWDDVDWIHWLRVWPQQIEFSSTLYAYFTMDEPLPAPNRPR
ncbi:MAG: serine hydrolase [Anaerolineae bacterium]|nr:serine hydrolase [Anaerolineae bacterium]